ncbi:MAG: hypothetical protein AAGI53_09460 [Planctomycetota bacterium]
MTQDDRDRLAFEAADPSVSGALHHAVTNAVRMYDATRAAFPLSVHVTATSVTPCDGRDRVTLSPVAPGGGPAVAMPQGSGVRVELTGELVGTVAVGDVWTLLLGPTAKTSDVARVLNLAQRLSAEDRARLIGHLADE